MTRINLESALHHVRQAGKKMACTESNDVKFFNKRTLRQARSAEITDHEPPRFVFSFPGGGWATYEMVEEGERKIVPNPPLFDTFPSMP